jgi:hypothetical protein
MKKPKPKNPTLPRKEDKSKIALGFILGLLLCLGGYIVHSVVDRPVKEAAKDK